ncbi:hypothetical protein Taro_011170, partial [Colocasia esculenta]|nr:hypothetical protein [Colocasia esculenta]
GLWGSGPAQVDGPVQVDWPGVGGHGGGHGRRTSRWPGAGLTMSRSTRHRGESSGASHPSESTVRRTNDPMPSFVLGAIRKEDLPRLDRGIRTCARGPLEEPSPSEGVVDLDLVDRSGRVYQYLRGDNYPRHFPLDEHLFPFIWDFVPSGWDGPAELLATERVQMQRVILVGRDSMLGTCSFHYPSFPLGYPAQVHFPDAGQLGLFGSEPVYPVGEAKLAQGLWEVHGQPKTRSSFAGHVLLPSGSQFAPEGYYRHCFLDRILGGEAASWYDRWFVISSHSFRFGATEWLMGVLHHYRELLDQVGIFHAVAATLHDYPYHSGLLQALAERFNRRFNTFGTAEVETCLDLWAFHRISGLPISGQFYEEVCLDDLRRDQSFGAGFYILLHNFWYLMKVWRDLARCGREQCPSASKGTVRVSCNAWVRFFYNGPFCFNNRFASDSRDPAEYLQLSMDLEDNAKYLCAPRDGGWNPSQLLDRTHLAAYLVYWLSTFVLPFGEEGLIRPELIYPACLLADDVRLALASTALANIFHSLGDLTASSSPRDRSVILGGYLFLEPYYLSRFARNFGYDQAVPPNADFALAVRSYKDLDRHLVASSWWCYFTKHDPSLECFIPEQQREGHVDIFYSRWWSRHNQAFRERASQIKEAESARLSRTNVPVPQIASDFIRREFPALVERVQALSRQKARVQASGPAERKAYVGALKPLVRPESTLSSTILPGSFNNLWREWERHIRHSIARAGLTEFISRVKSGTSLLDFWGAVVEAGKVVKTPPEKVVLPPDFSPTPGASQTPGSEDPVGATPRDDVIPPVDDDYNPTFDRTPSPDAAALKQYVPANIIVGEGAEHPDATTFGVDGSTSLKAIHDLLISGPKTGLPGFSDFAFGMPEGGTWPQVLHSAMTVSSTAVLPTASPPEEGEVPRGTTGESEDTVRLIQEMMESSPSAAIPPSVADVAGAEITFHNAAVASSAPGTSEPLPGVSSDALAGERPRLPEASGLEAAIGEAGGEAHSAEASEDAPAPLDVPVTRSGPLWTVSSGALFEESGAFPDHSILWLSAPQSVHIPDAGGMLESLLRPARSAMEASSPPSIEVVQGFLYRSTLTYHLMGYPRDPWMAAVDSLWSEVKQRFQEATLAANRLKIQELTAEIALVE